VITWQPGDPLPPWTDRRQGERRGHGRPQTVIKGDEWLSIFIIVLALAALIVSLLIDLG
jgi:hypothetical protein